ncbi:hypothetical protein FA95DRAFT_900403 [Auriscalpium vulgare]|uniref:Uncharacterized protein n=1 Tax=Auriscalpium vulgare TaxID=40419 RepID=A0ACB8R9Q4_9AGAM|nr:hypothetical protein FA95DRAFT_900403 [Auriscalpium vulgare]
MSSLQAKQKKTAKAVRLDNEISRIETHLRSLRQLRNSTQSPASCLPVEVLAHVFSFLRVSHFKPHRSPNFPPAWVAVTHVCSRWREVALSFPALWSNIVVYNPDWLEATLARSKATPLSLMMYLDRPGLPVHPWVESDAYRHIQRVKDLVLRGTGVNDYVRPLIGKRAPLLETLELWEDTHEEIHLVRKGLFEGETPKLRTLKLRRCRFLWTSTLFKANLTHLEVHKMLDEYRPTTSVLVNLLEGLPNLQTLALCHCLPTVGKVSTQSIKSSVQTKATLPWLTSLALSSECAPELFNIISHLSVPTDAAFRLVCDSIDEERVTFTSAPLVESIMSLLGFQESTTPPPPKPYSALRICKIAHESGWALLLGSFSPMFMARWGSDEPITAGDTGHWKCNFYIGLPWTASRTTLGVAVSVFATACTLLTPALAGVTSAFVDCVMFSEAQVWWDVFGRMANIRSISVSDRAAYGFAKVLKGVGRKAGDGPLAAFTSKYAGGIGSLLPHLFPQLTHINIEGANLNSYHLYDNLKAALGFRAVRKNGLMRVRRLAIKDCDVHDMQIMHLAAYLPKPPLDWDRVHEGMGQFYSSRDREFRSFNRNFWDWEDMDDE